MSPSAYQDRHKDASIQPTHQHFDPIPTLESLDNEGLIQSREGQAEGLYRFDREHQKQHADSGDESRQAGGDPASQGARLDEEVDGVEEEQGLFRGTSVDWKRERDQSRETKRWWRRPHPNWLLAIQLGQAMCMGMAMAPKAEIYNSLACMIHYPSTSSEQPQPAQPSPTVPVMPAHPLPSSPSTETGDFQVNFLPASHGSSPHYDLVSQKLSTKLKTIIGIGANSSSSAPHEVGGVLIDPLKCRKSPEVQSAAARFTTTMTITQGVLAALTTGWWGRASDKYGRTKIMGTAMVGILISDVIFLVTAKFPLKVPGAYRFLIVGPLIDGLLGGYPTIGATNNAYIADCTPDGTRAQVYSKYMGIMMVGIALGPIVGTAIIRQTGDILSVFYFSTATHIFMFFLVLFILPESLSASAKSFLSTAAAERKRTQAEQEELERRWEEEDTADEDAAAAAAGASGWSRMSGMGHTALGGRKGRGKLRRFAKRAFGFLEPLEIFMPKPDENDPTGRKDWNLTFLAIGNAILMTTMGVFALKFAYVQLKFAWGPNELGPMLTLMGSLRGLHLLVLLPLIVRYCKPKSPVAVPSLDDEPDAPSKDAPAHPLHDSKFDLRILQCSIAIDALSYTLILLSNNPVSFLLATAGTCFGGGAGPALSSLALALLPSAKHSGRLFGGLAVLQACLSTVAGPLLFGITYSLTTKTYPKTIFLMTVIFFIAALVCFSLIRLGPRTSHPEAAQEDRAEEQRQENRKQRRERGRDRKPRRSAHETQQTEETS